MSIISHLSIASNCSMLEWREKGFEKDFQEHLFVVRFLMESHASDFVNHQMLREDGFYFYFYCERRRIILFD